MKKAWHTLIEHPSHERSKLQYQTSCFLKGILLIEVLSFNILRTAIAAVLFKHLIKAPVGTEQTEKIRFKNVLYS